MLEAASSTVKSAAVVSCEVILLSVQTPVCSERPVFFPAAALGLLDSKAEMPTWKSNFRLATSLDVLGAQVPQQLTHHDTVCLQTTDVLTFCMCHRLRTIMTFLQKYHVPVTLHVYDPTFMG